jgi:hypothetical protein
MKPVKFTVTIHKFDKQGEKTGWTYFEVPAAIAQQLKPANRKEFKVKGRLDKFNINRVSLLPIGSGKFIMPLNASMRKGTGKKAGATLQVQLEEDTSDFIFNTDFMDCLADEPNADKFFRSLPGSHQRYFSKWIDSAKTEHTRIKRIAMAVDALAKKMGYPEMLRLSRGKAI